MLQNKSVICSGSQVANSTVMKLHGSDDWAGITINIHVYKEHLLTSDFASVQVSQLARYVGLATK